MLLMFDYNRNPHIGYPNQKSWLRPYGSWFVGLVTKSDAVKQLSSVWKAIRAIWNESPLSSCRRRSVVHHRRATVNHPRRCFRCVGVFRGRCTVVSASARWREGRRLCGWVSPTPPCTYCRCSSPATCPLQSRHSSHKFTRLGLSHRDPYAVRRGGCLELYYCNMVEWSWWDSGLIWKTN